MIPISQMKLGFSQFKAVAIGSMEQIIGAGLSAVVGVIIPMLNLIAPHQLPTGLQGFIGAIGLIGIAIGSAVIGRLSDKFGYAGFYRLCPILMICGSALIFFLPHIFWLITGLFIIGFGVGGGYSLDSSYISELMPDKWKIFMVGVAKATSALGFLLFPGLCWIILKYFQQPDIWNWLILLIGIAGSITLLLRISYPDTPEWLLSKGRQAEAQEAAHKLFGSQAEVLPPSNANKSKNPSSWIDMFRGENLNKVIFSGIPWALEGVGVYGIGVFLPVLVMALGLETTQSEGIGKVITSVGLTTIINFFILPGFIIGLWVMRRVWHVRMLSVGFLLYAIGVGIVLLAYLLHWPIWISILGFIIFEFFLNYGPHLITFVIPSQIYDINDRGAGTGIAAMLGKVGAIAGVFLMPLLLQWGGIKLVLIFCITVGILGAWISEFYGRKVLPHTTQRELR